MTGWRRITTPPATVTDDEAIRHIRLYLSIVMVLLVLWLMGVFVSFVSTPSYMNITWPVLLSMALSFGFVWWLGKSGRVQFGIGYISLTLYASGIAFFLENPTDAQFHSFVYHALISVFIVALFKHVLFTSTVAIIYFATLLVLQSQGISSDTFYSGVLGQLGVSLMIVIISSIRQRTQDDYAQNAERYRQLISNLPDTTVALFDERLTPTLADATSTNSAVFEQLMRDMPTPHRAALNGFVQTVEWTHQQENYLVNLLPLSHHHGAKSAMAVLTNVTQQKTTHDSLQRLVSLEILLDVISTGFLTLEGSLIDSGINDALQALVEVLEVDWSYVFVLAEDGQSLQRRYEWQKPHTKTVEMPTELPLDVESWSIKRLRRYETIEISRLDDLPTDAVSERDHMQTFDIGSQLLIPLIYVDKWRGYLCFATVGHEKQWLEEDVALLRRAGDIFINALERKRFEQELRSERNFITALFDTVSAVVLVLEPDGTIVQANRAFEELFGSTLETVRGSQYRLLFREAQHARFIENILDTVQHDSIPQHGEDTVQLRDGTQVLLAWSATVMVYAEQNLVIITGIDITERRRMEGELRKSEVRYRKVTSTITDFAYELHVNEDQQLFGQWLSESFESVTGYAFEDVSEVGGLRRILHPEDRSIVRQHLANAIAGQNVVSEYRIVTRDGDTRWIRDYILPDYNENAGRVVRVYGAAQDITEQRIAEQERLNFALEQERLQTLEAFISEISHDLRTPLAVMNTKIYLIKKLAESERQIGHIDGLERQIVHLQRMVEELLTMARLDKADDMAREPVNINTLMDGLASEVETLIERKQLSLEVNLCNEDPMLLADEFKLRRAILNCIYNAIDYTPEGGHVTLGTSIENGEAILAISDTGIGIKEEDLPRIFDRFYRAQREIRAELGGTGLGLAIVKRIIELHHGRVEIETALNQGTTFFLHLPLEQK